jgi:anti-sigma B factor antagonist
VLSLEELAFTWRSAMNETTVVRQVGSVSILDVKGRLVFGEESARVREMIMDLLGKGRKQILLNLRDVEYIDSMGLGSLVGSLATVRKQGGDLKLLNVNDRLTDIMQITRLYHVFDTSIDEREAIKSFGVAAATD